MLQGIKNIYHLLVAISATVFFRFPARNLIVIGVTGTDGKTTTVNLIYEILKKAGKKVAMVSSVGAKIGGQDYDLPFHVTTPSSWQLQKFLRLAVSRGDRYLVLEVTSHALDQNRVFGIPFRIGVLTNITHEHWDYHKTFENYVKVKMKLFRGVEWAIVNKDFLDKSFKVDASFTRYSRFTRSESKGLKVISYGIKTGEVNALNFPFTTSLPGDYNKQNCLAAIAVGKVLKIDEKIIRETLAGFKGVSGRFELTDSGRGYQILIDFAHTPNALEQLLSTVRPKVKGKIIHVFGSAGLRDFTKRPLMGEIAGKYDDVIILTEEDYRTENVNKIMEEIESGILRNSKLETQNSKQIQVFKIPNRQEAINKAIKMAKKGDWVVLTGKGHEKSLCRGKIEDPWSEHEAVKKALNFL